MKDTSMNRLFDIADVTPGAETTVVVRGIIVFDGSCGFCTWSMAKLKKHDARGDFAFTCSQLYSDRALLELGVTREESSHEVLLIRDDGKIYRGAAAINWVLGSQRRWSRIIDLIESNKLLFCLERLAYKSIATNRELVSRVLGTAKFALFCEK